MKRLIILGSLIPLLLDGCATPYQKMGLRGGYSDAQIDTNTFFIEFRGNAYTSRQPKRGRLWLTDGSCLRLRPEYPNHVWAYDFVADRTHERKAFRMLAIIDEYTRECLAIVVGRRITSHDVLYTLADLFIRRGIPEYIRSDNGPEICARAVREWLSRLGVRTLFIEPGSPWENGYVESFIGKLRDELLNWEIFYTLKEATILIEQWRRHYNGVRPHSALGYRPPAPEAVAFPGVGLLSTTSFLEYPGGLLR
jgi:putative transposase